MTRMITDAELAGRKAEWDKPSSGGYLHPFYDIAEQQEEELLARLERAEALLREACEHMPLDCGRKGEEFALVDRIAAHFAEVD